MTARQVWEGMLTELSKVNAPSMLLQDFNYFFNKAISQYINKRYNIYDINQQTSDDLRVLKATSILEAKPATQSGPLKTLVDLGAGKSKLFGATYEVTLPSDYLHILNCVCIYYVAKQKDCYDAGSYIQIPATRLTADSWSQIVTDIYNRPTPMHPYYYIHNQNTNITLPTAPVTGNGEVSDDNPSGYSGTDLAGKYEVTDTDGGVATSTNGGSNFQRTFQLNNNQQISLVEKPTATRIANPTNVRCEIRYGRDDSLFQLVEVQIDYVKSPQFIRLTQEQIDLTEDTSQIMEFPDYVNQEIINELVHLVMVHSNDPRLPNDMQITNTIARPTGQQQQAAPQQAAQ